MAGYKFNCGEKGKKEANGCKTSTVGVKCYCTGSKCKHCNPTDKKDKSCEKTKPKKNSANTIGTQATIGFALFLAFFSKIMAWMIFFESLRLSFWIWLRKMIVQNNSFDYTFKNIWNGQIKLFQPCENKKSVCLALLKHESHDLNYICFVFWLSFRTCTAFDFFDFVSIAVLHMFNKFCDS